MTIGFVQFYYMFIWWEYKKQLFQVLLYLEVILVQYYYRNNKSRLVISDIASTEDTEAQCVWRSGEFNQRYFEDVIFFLL